MGQQSALQLAGVQARTLPVGLTTICLQLPLRLRNRIRLALAVPRGEKEIEPSLVMVVPSANGLVASAVAFR